MGLIEEIINFNNDGKFKKIQQFLKIFPIEQVKKKIQKGHQKKKVANNEKKICLWMRFLMISVNLLYLHII